MPLNQSDRKFFEILQENIKKQRANPEDLTIQAIRSSINKLDIYVEAAPPIPYEDKILRCKDGHAIKMRYYHANNDIKPLIIFFPGNGFVYELFEANHSIISKIAHKSGCHAVMVDYRLAPEYPYPCALHDALEAFNYVIANRQAFHADKIIIMGFSSGANLAAVITNQLRHQNLIFHQFLISGGFDYTNSLHEYDEYGVQDKLLSPEEAQFSFNSYCKESERTEPTCSPYWEEDLSGLPPTTIMVAEYDGGRSQSEGYAKKLIEAGNKVTKIVLSGQTHGTILYRKVLSDGMDPAYVAAEQILKITR